MHKKTPASRTPGFIGPEATNLASEQQVQKPLQRWKHLTYLYHSEPPMEFVHESNGPGILFRTTLESITTAKNK